jgi:hypothetical protein
MLGFLAETAPPALEGLDCDFARVHFCVGMLASLLIDAAL